MQPTTKQPIVLVVDDNPGVLALIERALGRAAWKIAAVPSGADALAFLAENTADLLLIDLALPGTDAKGLIERLAATDRSIPFIIVTSERDEHVAAEMMKHGALNYLVKDAEFLDFLPEVVARALQQLGCEKRLRRAEETLRASEARLRSTLDNMLEGCQIIGPDWRYSYVNAAAARHGRKTREELIGRTVMEMYPGIENTRIFEVLRRCMEERIPSRVETEFAFPDGSKGVFEVSAVPFEDGILILSYDITARKHLEKEVLEISEREQSRIGQDLHDSLCQDLAGIEFQLQGVKQKLVGKSKSLRREIDELSKLIRDAIEQTRTLAHGLSPIMTGPEGLMGALQELSERTEHTFRVSCAFNCPTPIWVHSRNTATHLYRIAQEAIQNSVRHGRPKFIVTTLTMENSHIILGVKDDGVGFENDGHTGGKGMGLRVMQYRAGMAGGSLVVHQGLDRGTSVICSVPAEAPKTELRDDPYII